MRQFNAKQDADPIILNARALRKLIDCRNYWELKLVKGEKKYFPKATDGELFNNKFKTISNPSYLKHYAGQITLGYSANPYAPFQLLMFEVDSNNQNNINKTFANIEQCLQLTLQKEHSSTFKTLSHSYVLVQKGVRTIKQFRDYIANLENYLNLKCAEADCKIEIKGLPTDYTWQNKRIVAKNQSVSAVAKLPRQHNFYNFINKQILTFQQQTKLAEEFSATPTKVSLADKPQGSFDKEMISQGRFEKEFKRCHNFIKQQFTFREDGKVLINNKTFKGVISKDTLALAVYSIIKCIDKQTSLTLEDAPVELSEGAKKEYLLDVTGAVSYSMVQKRYSHVMDARSIYSAEVLKEVDAMSLNRTAKFFRFMFKLLIANGLIANTGKQRFIGAGNKGNRGKRYAIKINPLNQVLDCSSAIATEQGTASLVPSLNEQGYLSEEDTHGGDNTTCNSMVSGCVDLPVETSPTPLNWVAPAALGGSDPCSAPAEQSEIHFESITEAVRFVSQSPQVQSSQPAWLRMQPVAPKIEEVVSDEPKGGFEEQQALMLNDADAIELDNLIDSLLSSQGSVL